MGIINGTEFEYLFFVSCSFLPQYSVIGVTRESDSYFDLDNLHGDHGFVLAG